MPSNRCTHGSSNEMAIISTWISQSEKSSWFAVTSFLNTYWIDKSNGKCMIWYNLSTRMKGRTNEKTDTHIELVEIVISTQLCPIRSDPIKSIFDERTKQREEFTKNKKIILANTAIRLYIGIQSKKYCDMRNKMSSLGTYACTFRQQPMFREELIWMAYLKYVCASVFINSFCSNPPKRAETQIKC